MQKNAFAGFVGLLRPLNCIMAAFAVFVGYSVSIRAFQFNRQIALAMLAAFLVCGAGQAINDYFDRQIDKKKNPRKPIPSGAISAGAALYYSFALFIAGNAAAWLVNQTAFAIANAFTLLLVLYSAFLGKAKWLGNWVVAAGTAFTLVFGSALSGNFLVVLFFAASALLSNVAREIIKDAEDLQSDKGHKKSLPMMLERKQLLLLVLLLSVAAFLLSFLPLLLGLFGNMLFIAMMLVANAIFFYAVFCFTKKNYALAQRAEKAGMFLALLAFLAGVV